MYKSPHHSHFIWKFQFPYILANTWSHPAFKLLTIGETENKLHSSNLAYSSHSKIPFDWMNEWMNALSVVFPLSLSGASCHICVGHLYFLSCKLPGLHFCPFLPLKHHFLINLVIFKPSFQMRHKELFLQTRFLFYFSWEEENGTENINTEATWTCS